MRKKQVRFEPDQLIAMQKRIDMAIKSSNQAHLIITLAVLHDAAEWSAEECQWFVDRYEEFLTSYGAGKEHSVDELNRDIYEETGIMIMDISEEESNEKYTDRSEQPSV